MHLITLGEIIKTMYECYHLKPKTDRNDLKFILNGDSDTEKLGSLLGVTNDRMFTSLRTGGVCSKSSCYYPKVDQDKTINNILKGGRNWLDVFVDHLKKDNGPNFKIRMNRELITFIHNTIYDETIEINDDFRQFLKHPMVNNGVVLDKQEGYWLRFCWLVIFSVFQNKRITELKELWDIPDEARLNCSFDCPLEWSSYCSSGNAKEVFKITTSDNGTIDINVNFSIHRHIAEIPEWGSIVFWLPGRPKDYREFEGYMKYEICALSGINSVSIELQNSTNEGGHKYFSPHKICEKWESRNIDFTKKTIPLNILKSFGAVCFVIHPDDFCDSEYKAHFQLRNLGIELR